jgi:TctA family transporter
MSGAEVFDALITGLTSVLAWPAIGFMVLGVFIGMWMGAVPGLGGVLGMILLLPFTFDMEPVNAFALLLGMFAVTSTSDTIASVMLGIPGTAASQATILDGYPLAQKGQAARAFGAAFTVSAFGGVFGAVVLAISLPLITPIITAFKSGEIFMLAILGLAMVGSLSGGSITKGVIAALLGLLISTIGPAQTVAIYRYTFNQDYLLDGLPIVPVVLGLFAIPELMELATRNVNISRVSKEQADGGGMLDGIRDAFKHWWLATRCATIGTYIGIVPGLGAAIVDWVAYGHAVQSAKDKSNFGKGDIRGVIAPEAANNAIKGGALIPTLAFGIPGSLGMAILLGALLIVGLLPGPDMLTTDLPITFAMVWTIVLANILAAIVLMVLAKYVAKVAFISGHLIVPGVMLFIFMGAWLAGGTSLGAWITCLTFGILGYLMKVTGWARPPLVLGLILGGISENRFQLATLSEGSYAWLSRPIVLIIMGLIVVTIILAARGIVKNRQSGDKPEVGEGRGLNPIMSLPFSLLILSIFAGASAMASNWDIRVSQFPLAVAIPGAALALFAIYIDVKALNRVRKTATDWSSMFVEASELAVLPKSLRFISAIIGMILIMLLIGQKIAIPIFIFLYLIFWAKRSISVGLVYASLAWMFLVVFYDRIIHMQFHQPYLADTIASFIPAFLPIWIFF